MRNILKEMPMTVDGLCIVNYCEYCHSGAGEETMFHCSLIECLYFVY